MKLKISLKLEVTPKNFGRIAAQTAKQVVTQRVREAERGIIYSEFIDREEDIMTGIVQRQDARFIYVSLGKLKQFSSNEQMPNERYKPHDRIKVFITKVEKTTKGHKYLFHEHIQVLLKRLFEIEVPEIMMELLKLNPLHVKQEIVRKFLFMQIILK